MATEIKLDPNYANIFRRMVDSIPAETADLIRFLDRPIVTDLRLEERKALVLEQRTKGMQNLNSLLFVIANALNCATTVAAINELRDVVNDSLIKVNEKFRDISEEEGA